MNRGISVCLQCKNGISYLSVIVTVFAGNLVCFFSNNIIVGVATIWITAILSVLYSGIDIMHPLTWFSGAFTVYSTAYMLLFLMDSHYVSYGCTIENIRYSMFALSVVLIFLGKKSVRGISVHDDVWSEDYSLIDHKSVEVILIVLSVASIVLTLIILRGGFINKATMASSGLLFTGCTYFIRIDTFLCCVYILGQDREKAVKKGVVILAAVSATFFGMKMAERDAIIRFLIMIVLVLWKKGIIKRKMLPIILPAGYIFLIMVNVLKYYFIDGTINPYYQKYGLLFQFLNSDFSVAGSNFQLLLNESTVTEGIAGYSTIVTDLLRWIVPNNNYFNASSWFNNLFFSESTWNRAFTLVGEGYVIGGVLGIILLFYVVSIVIRLSLKIANKGIWGMSFYIYSIISVISSFRSTLGDMLISMIRVPLLALVIFYLVKIIKSKGIIVLKL